QHLVDVLAVVVNLEDLGLIAHALAFLADELDVGEELHLNGDGAVALADFAAAAGDVEREVTRGVTAPLTLGLRGKDFADRVEGLDIGHRVGAGRPADGRLIDQHDLVDPFPALDAFDLRLDTAADLALFRRERVVQDVVYQR